MDYVTVHGVDVPAMGFGMWPMKGETCRTAVETALEYGYRHIDTAQMYENESAVGQAIADSGVPRDEVFVVMKLLRRKPSTRRCPADRQSGSRSTKYWIY